MKNVILDEFLNTENVYFSEPVKNTVIPNSNFRRIIYSNSYVSLNNIHLRLQLDNIKISKFYQKFKCIFDYQNIKSHNDILKITNIEKNILSKIKIKDKLPKFSILEQARNGFIKFSMGVLYKVIITVISLFFFFISIKTLYNNRLAL